MEMVATCAIVGINWKTDCGHPLTLWVSVFSLRFLFSIPLHVARLRQQITSEETRKKLRLIQLGSFFWFIIGQSWVYDSTCTDSSLYIYCFTLIVMVYISLLLPLLILIGLCVCAPVVLMVFRRFSREGTGASSYEIDNLESIRYNPENVDENADSGCAICMVDYEEQP
eukprot:UN31631